MKVEKVKKVEKMVLEDWYDAMRTGMGMKMRIMILSFLKFLAFE